MTMVDFQAGAKAVDTLIQTNPASYPVDLSDLSFDIDFDLAVDSFGEGSTLPEAIYEINPKPAFYWPLELNVNRIAVLSSRAISNFIFSLPAMEALRTAYPAAEIVLLGHPWHQEFLYGRPGPVDRVEIIPQFRGVREGDQLQENPEEQQAFFECMRAQQFDLAIQLHGDGLHSNPFVRLLGAKLTVGMQALDASGLDRCVPYHYFQNDVLRYLEVVSMVGATPRTVVPRVLVTSRDLDESYSQFSNDSRPLVVLHPGAGDPRRRWPVEKFVTVGNALAWSGASVVVIGTESEQELANQLVGQMSTEAINLCGKTSINGLTGLLSRASVVISNDSGPLHLGAAVGSPTVGIFWLSNAILAAPTTRSHHRPAIAWRVNCPVCGLDTTRNDCDHNVSWVADVSQEEIIESAIDLLRMDRNSVDVPSSSPFISF